MSNSNVWKSVQIQRGCTGCIEEDLVTCNFLEQISPIREYLNPLKGRCREDTQKKFETF